jgi:hypothetical protein
VVNLRTIPNWKQWLARPDTAYVGRDHPVLGCSKFANPFRINNNLSRAESVAKFRDYFLNSPLIDSIHELDGMEMGCWCAEGQLCHTSVLLEALISYYF